MNRAAGCLLNVVIGATIIALCVLAAVAIVKAVR